MVLALYFFSKAASARCRRFELRSCLISSRDCSSVAWNAGLIFSTTNTAQDLPSFRGPTSTPFFARNIVARRPVRSSSFWTSAIFPPLSREASWAEYLRATAFQL
jgi:hypothetical protein